MAMLRSYIVKSTYNWLVDHGFTPYILVDTEYDNLTVPTNYIDEDSKILLDLSPEAIDNINFTDTEITFDATFDGEFMSLVIPIEATLELFSKETEQGLYAREFGYGININEGEDDDSINPSKVGENRQSSDNVLTFD